MAKKSRILIATSDPDLLSMARRALESAPNVDSDGHGGFEVTTADCREKALARARTELPNLVIIGYLEPRGESFTLHEQLNGHFRTRDIPLLVIDVRPQEHRQKGWIRAEGLRMQAEGYMSRPVETTELLQEVRRIMETTAHRQARLEETLAAVQHRMLREMEHWKEGMLELLERPRENPVSAVSAVEVMEEAGSRR